MRVVTLPAKVLVVAVCTQAKIIAHSSLNFSSVRSEEVAKRKHHIQSESQSNHEQTLELIQSNVSRPLVKQNQLTGVNISKVTSYIDQKDSHRTHRAKTSSTKTKKAKQRDHDESSLWRSSQVKYCLAPDLSHGMRKMFEMAVATYKDAIPCLQFVNVGILTGDSLSDRENKSCQVSPAIFVESSRNGGCFATPMDDKLLQIIQLSDTGCAVVGQILEELGTALGLARNATTDDNRKRAGFEEPAESGINMMAQQGGLKAMDVEQLVDMYSSGNCNSSIINYSIDGLGCVNDDPEVEGATCPALDTQVVWCSEYGFQHCCACGGGTYVECYEGSKCPTVTSKYVFSTVRVLLGGILCGTGFFAVMCLREVVHPVSLKPRNPEAEHGHHDLAEDDPYVEEVNADDLDIMFGALDPSFEPKPEPVPEPIPRKSWLKDDRHWRKH